VAGLTSSFQGIGAPDKAEFRAAFLWITPAERLRRRAMHEKPDHEKWMIELLEPDCGGHIG
jgi:hypothetical protein